MKTIYILLISIFLVNTMFATDKPRQGTISDIIVDEQNKPIDYVTVGLFKTADSSLVKTALTTTDGKFEFVNISTGSYFVKATMMGYGAYKGKSFLFGESSLSFLLESIQLKTEGKTLNTVIINATKPLIERKVDKMVMNVENGG